MYGAEDGSSGASPREVSRSISIESWRDNRQHVNDEEIDSRKPERDRWYDGPKDRYGRSDCLHSLVIMCILLHLICTSFFIFHCIDCMRKCLCFQSSLSNPVHPTRRLPSHGMILSDAPEFAKILRFVQK